MSVHKPTLVRDLMIIISGLIIAGLLYTFSAAYFVSPGGALPGEVPPQGDVSIRGTMVCLPHKNTKGPQTLECAFGLEDEQGLYYGLRDSDPTYKNVSSVPMNVPVLVEGIFTPQGDQRYQSVGVIDVMRVSVLDTPRRMGISGTLECLPHKDPKAMTDECAQGVRMDDGTHYALDFGMMSQMPPEFVAGERLEAEGVFTPLEELSTDHWQQYDIAGIFSVTNIVDTKAEKPVLQ